MADNTQLGASDPAGAIAATDEIGGVHYQRIKVGHGADGSYIDTSAAAPLPVADKNGSGAVRYTSDTTAVTGTTFAQIMCLTATTFSTLTRTNATGSLTGISLPAGTLLIGPFTAYTLTSGVVAAYV